MAEVVPEQEEPHELERIIDTTVDTTLEALHREVVAEMNRMQNLSYLQVINGPRRITESYNHRTGERYIFMPRFNINIPAEIAGEFPIRFRQIIQLILERTAEERSQAYQQPRIVKEVLNTFGTEFTFNKKRKRDAEQEEDEFRRCSICMEDFKPREKIRQLHGRKCCFHKRCINKWFKENSTCPNCGLDCGVTK